MLHMQLSLAHRSRHHVSKLCLRGYDLFRCTAGGWYNSIAFKHMREVEVPLLDAYHITLPMWQMHMKDKDCSHYCSPGAYEVWTYLLTDMLKGAALRD